MTGPIVERVLRSPRYRDVDARLVERLATEELAVARNADDAVKRVKRRLHQAVGAYRGRADVERVLGPIRAAWRGDLADAAVRDACRQALLRHASSAERVPDLERFYPRIWAATGGPPATLVDLGAGLGPLALPWMGLAGDAAYHACDVDGQSLATVAGFLDLVGQPATTHRRDLVADGPPPVAADVALLLKLVPPLDRQDPGAVANIIRGLRVRDVVISFPARSLGGRRRGMERTYRGRMEALAAEVGADAVHDVSVPTELVFVMRVARG